MNGNKAMVETAFGTRRQQTTAVQAVIAALESFRPKNTIARKQFRADRAADQLNRFRQELGYHWPCEPDRAKMTDRRFPMNPAKFRLEMPDDAMCAILRRKTEAERLTIAFRMWGFARDLIRSSLRQEHPEWSNEEIDRQTARRLSHGAC